MKNSKRSLILTYIFFLIIVIFGGYYFYQQLLAIDIPIHSDDADSAIAFFDERFWGGIGKAKGKLQVFMIISNIVYHIVGYSEYGVRIIFVLQYCLALFLALFLLKKINESNNLTIIELPIFCFFVLLQGKNGPAEVQISKFHVNSTICLFMLLLCLYCYQKCKKRKYLVLSAFIFIFSVLQLDYLLCLIIVILPIFVFFLWDKIKENSSIILLLGIIFISLLAIYNIVLLILSFWGLDFEINLTGWGVIRNAASITQIGDNLVLFFEGLLGMFNCNIGNQNLVDVYTLLKVLKALFVVAMIGVLILRNIDIFIKKRNVSMLESVLVFACDFDILAFFVSYEVDAISMRYCSFLLYALPLISLGYLKDKIDLNKVIWKTKYTITMKVGISLFFGMFCLAMIENVWDNTRTTMPNDNLAKIIIENDLKFGVGPFWASKVITILTGERSVVQSVEMKDNNINPFLTVASIYEDKALQFNYIISDMEKNYSYDDAEFNVVEENILEKYDNEKKIIDVDEDKKIFIYDYDIRKYPIKLSNDNKIILDKNEKKKWNFYEFEIGEYYIDIEGENLKDINLKVDNAYVSLVKESKSFSRYEILINEFNLSHCIELINESEKQLKITKITVKTKRAAMDIKINNKIINENQSIKLKDELISDKISLDGQKYRIVMYGENIDQLSMEILGDIECSLCEQGERRAVYTVKANDSQDFKIKLINKGNDEIILNNFSYEMDEVQDEMIISETDLFKTGKMNDNIILQKDDVQYGPYYKLKKGKYKISCYGENLTKCTFWSYYDKAFTNVEIKNICIEDSCVSYYIELEKDVDDIEFLAKNENDDCEVRIDCYVIKEVE